MRWQGGRRSSNVGFGGRGGMAIGGMGAVVLAVVAMLFGVDPRTVLQGGGDPAATPGQAPAAGTPAAERADFSSVVLADTEDTWNRIFSQMGTEYQEPQLIIFENAVGSACGFAQSAVGPFYCPLDNSIYLDTGFFVELQERFAAPGDFAHAYVIAHEVGHHVQNQLGISERVRTAQQQVGQEEANQLSVRLELQADCFAGIWAHHTQSSQNVALERGDIEEALGAASAIGDDNLQRQAQGHVVPESFTHGSSAQRVRWFQEGYRSGDPARCDTLAAQRI